MHAKLAVADRRILLTTSANLTQSGVSTNTEAGLPIIRAESGALISTGLPLFAPPRPASR
jgi:phosphatidylserine/phosphatidylglycerophosphate/cardiolipin synthase-like enzyme